MAPTILNPAPEQVTAGDSIAWRVADSAHPAGDGWALSLTLVSPAGRITLPASTADGDGHIITVPPATTAAWAPGAYRLHVAATRAGERVTLLAADLEILPDPATATPYDGRSHARRLLAAIESWLESRNPTVAEYQVADRQMRYIPIPELLALRDRYRAEVRREDAIARTGRPFNKLQVRL